MRCGAVALAVRYLLPPHAADLGMGLPAAYAVTTCVFGVRLGARFNFDHLPVEDRALDELESRIRQGRMLI